MDKVQIRAHQLDNLERALEACERVLLNRMIDGPAMEVDQSFLELLKAARNVRGCRIREESDV